MSKKIVIKKYNNRRLYNTDISKYITLSQVSELIKDMKNVHVVDAKTNEDVTAYILTQIVLEDAKNNNALLPVPLLHMLIRYGDNVLKEFFDNHLHHIIENYIRQKSEFDDHFRKMLEIGSEFTNITRKTLADISPVRTFMDIFGTAGANEAEKEGGPAKEDRNDHE